MPAQGKTPPSIHTGRDPSGEVQPTSAPCHSAGLLPSSPTSTMEGSAVPQHVGDSGQYLTFTADSSGAGSITLPSPVPTSRQGASTGSITDSQVTTSSRMSLQSTDRPYAPSSFTSYTPSVVESPRLRFMRSIGAIRQGVFLDIETQIQAGEDLHSCIFFVDAILSIGSILGVLSSISPIPISAATAQKGWDYFISCLVDEHKASENPDALPQNVATDQILSEVLQQVNSLIASFWASLIHPTLHGSDSPATTPSGTGDSEPEQGPASSLRGPSEPLDHTSHVVEGHADAGHVSAETGPLLNDNNDSQSETVPPQGPPPSTYSNSTFGTTRTSHLRSQAQPALFTLPNSALPESGEPSSTTQHLPPSGSPQHSGRSPALRMPRSWGLRPFSSPSSWLTASPAQPSTPEERETARNRLPLDVRHLPSSRSPPPPPVAHPPATPLIRISTSSTEAEVAAMGEVVRKTLVNLTEIHTSGPPGVKERAGKEVRGLRGFLRNIAWPTKKIGSRSPSPSPSATPIASSPNLGRGNTDASAPSGLIPNILPSSSGGIARADPRNEGSSQLPAQSPPTLAEAERVRQLLSVEEEGALPDPHLWRALYERHVGLCSFVVVDREAQDLWNGSDALSVTPGASTSTASIHPLIGCINPRHQELDLPCSLPTAIEIEVNLSRLLQSLERSQNSRISQLMTIIAQIIVDSRDHPASSSPSQPSHLSSPPSTAPTSSQTLNVTSHSTPDPSTTTSSSRRDKKGKGRQKMSRS